jgi:hypothetical protein
MKYFATFYDEREYTFYPLLSNFQNVDETAEMPVFEKTIIEAFQLSDFTPRTHGADSKRQYIYNNIYGDTGSFENNVYQRLYFNRNKFAIKTDNDGNISKIFLYNALTKPLVFEYIVIQCIYDTLHEWYNGNRVINEILQFS